MPITASQLRADVYRLLDRAIETGEVLEIERNGKLVRLVPPPERSWIDRLPRREGVVVGDPEELVHVDWSSEWSQDLPVIHLDTHAVVWLYQGAIERFPESVRRRLSTEKPLYSPMVRLELALLHEIGRLSVAPGEILDTLAGYAGLRAAERDSERVSRIAATLTWTRNPFDRMIAAHALADDLPLLTRDASILANCPVAQWE